MNTPASGGLGAVEVITRIKINRPAALTVCTVCNAKNHAEIDQDPRAQFRKIRKVASKSVKRARLDVTIITP
jgi:hypothetical protein